MSETCGFVDCSALAEFVCSCEFLLCAGHIGRHIKTNSGHTLVNIHQELDEEEIGVLRSAQSHVESYIAQRSSELDKELEQSEEKYLKSIEEARDMHLREKEVLFTCKEEMESTVMDIVTSGRILANSSSPAIQAIKKLRDTVGDLHDLYTLQIFMQDYIMNLGQTTPKYTVGLSNGNICTLNENLKEKTAYHYDEGWKYYSNCLLLNDGSILIVTYVKVLKLWPEKGTIEDVAKVQVNRMYHTMAFIQGKPAVIGGYYGGIHSTCEVFDGKTWEYTAELNVARCSANGCHLGEFTYVFGGYNGATWASVTDTIERFDKDSWTVLNVKMPVPLAEIGVFGHSNYVVLLGGSANMQNVNTVYKWEGGETWEQLEPLSNPTKFSVNVWLLHKGSIIAYDDNPTRVSYPLRLNN